MWRRARLTAAILVAAMVPLFVSSAAWAARPHSYGTDQLALSHEIPITNPADGLSYPSVLLVSGARLDSQMPDGSGVSAPDGELYLTLQMSSGPVQRSYNDPSYGDFFSNMTPLPASAFECRSTKGRIYPMTRSDPANETVTADADTADGLVAATYACLVPDTFRAGSVVIIPSSTIGTEYQNMTGDSPTVLHVGGPTTIQVQFPAQLTVDSPPTTETTGGAATTPGSSSRSGGFVGGVLLVVVVAGVTFYLVRRRPKDATTPHPPPPVDVVAEQVDVADAPESPAEQPSGSKDEVAPEAAPEAAQHPASDDEAPSWRLRVNVLGALNFEPSVRGLSDPARSILCFLAFHRKRAMSGGEVQTAVWPMRVERDVSRATFHNYVAEARKAVGAEVLPEASRGAGYRLLEVTTDLEQFRALVEAARGADDDTSATMRLQALELVREYPFASETSPFFEWIRSEGLEGQVVRLISDTASRTGIDLRRLGRLDDAEMALRKGLLAAPATMLLWEELTEVIMARGDGEALRQHWVQADIHLSASEVSDLRRRVQA